MYGFQVPHSFNNVPSLTTSRPAQPPPPGPPLLLSSHHHTGAPQKARQASADADISPNSTVAAQLHKRVEHLPAAAAAAAAARQTSDDQRPQTRRGKEGEEEGEEEVGEKEEAQHIGPAGLVAV